MKLRMSPISMLWKAGMGFDGSTLPGKYGAMRKIRQQPFFK